MVRFTHPCREGLGVLLLVAERARLDLGASLEPAEKNCAEEKSREEWFTASSAKKPRGFA
jgi:hypothetical protein